MTTRVVLADDHKIVRDGLCSLLKANSSIEVVGVADNGRAVLDQVNKLKPDVVLMDISMPELNGIEATRKICAEYPDVKVIMLSMHSERRFVVEALNAGARGFLLKDSAFEDLITAIRTVEAGDFYLNPKIAGIVVTDYLRKQQVTTQTVFTLLTPREREVLQLVAEGKSTKEIAFSFDVSVKTVETQRAQIMKKLDKHSVAELTKYALHEGLTFLE